VKWTVASLRRLCFEHRLAAPGDGGRYKGDARRARIRANVRPSLPSVCPECRKALEKRS
jgi:hypothetical protein